MVEHSTNYIETVKNLTTINTFSFHVGLEVSHIAAVLDVPLSISSSDKDYYNCVLDIMFLCVFNFLVKHYFIIIISPPVYKHVNQTNCVHTPITTSWSCILLVKKHHFNPNVDVRVAEVE